MKAEKGGERKDKRNEKQRNATKIRKKIFTHNVIDCDCGRQSIWLSHEMTSWVILLVLIPCFDSLIHVSVIHFPQSVDYVSEASCTL